MGNNSLSKHKIAQTLMEQDAMKKRRFNSSYEIVQDFSDYASIQGLVYIFFGYQTIFGRIFWIIVVALMLGLGVYWIIQAYTNWQDRPVLTSITTTAYSVKQVSRDIETEFGKNTS